MIDWFDQEAIAASSAVVVGVGATGNELLKNLCLLGIGEIHVIDYDLIEAHNLTRAVLFTEADVGRHKAEAAADACHRLDPNICVTYDTEDAWKSLTIERLRRYNALFCCVDNFDARIKLNRLCLLAGVDFYNAAVDSRFVVVERYALGSNPKGACYECNLPASVYGRIRERYSCGWLRKRAFEERKVPTTIITASMAGSGVCSLYLHRDRLDGPHGSVRCCTDTITFDSTVSLIQSNSVCPACSELQGRTQYFKLRKGRELPEVAATCGADEDVIIWLSDRVILDVSCRECGERRVINDLADKYDDTLLHCSRCDKDSNVVALKDFMTLGELREVFGGSIIPVKYLCFSVGGVWFISELEV